MSPKEAIVLAIKREETLHKFYKYLENIQPPGEIRNLLKEMALIKLEHKEKLEVWKAYWLKPKKRQPG